MKDNLFNNEKKRKAGISGFANLITQPGWKLLELIVEDNIKVLTELILDGRNLEGEEATEKETNRLRDKLQAYKEVISTPKRRIKALESPEHEEPNPDPYITAEELKRERKSKE